MIINNIERKSFWIIMDSVAFALILIQFILSILVLASNDLSLEYFIEIKANWERKPIYDIQLKTGEHCSDGYERLVFDYWLGTEEGCYCIDNDDDDDDDDDDRRLLRILGKHGNGNGNGHGQDTDLDKGKCSEKDLKKGCSNIPKNLPIELTKWDGHELCVKQQVHSDDYSNYVRSTIEEGFCESGYKPCGELDSLHQILCLQDSLPCPINNIIISGSATPPDSTYQTLHLTNYYIHTTTKMTHGRIPVSFKISEGNVCINPIEINTFYPPYELDANKDLYQCPTTIKHMTHDNRYALLSTQSKKSLYDQNDISPIIAGLPEYPQKSLDLNINLFYRNYIGFERECVDEHEVSKEMFSNIDKQWKTARGFHIATIVFILMAIVFLVGLIIAKIVVKYKLRTCHDILEGVYIFMSFLIFVMAVAAFNELNKINIDFDDCTDKITEEWFEEMKDILNGHKRYDIVIFVFGLLPLFLYASDCVLNKLLQKNTGEVEVIKIMPNLMKSIELKEKQSDKPPIEFEKNNYYEKPYYEKTDADADENKNKDVLTLKKVATSGTDLIDGSIGLGKSGSFKKSPSQFSDYPAPEMPPIPNHTTQVKETNNKDTKTPSNNNLIQSDISSSQMKNSSASGSSSSFPHNNH